MLLVLLHGGYVCSGECRASRLGSPCLELCHLASFLVPVMGRHLVDECNPSCESCIGPLGHVQVMDHLAGHTSGAMFAIAIVRDTYSERWVWFIDQGHHLILFPFEDNGAT